MRMLYILPRALGVLSIIFISIFALDAFSSGMPTSQALGTFAIHLIPSAVLVVILAIAWRLPLVGGVGFIIVSALPFFLLSNVWWVNVLLGGPFFITGVFFILSMRRERTQLAQTSANSGM